MRKSITLGVRESKSMALGGAAEINEKDLETVLDNFLRARADTVHLVFDAAEAGCEQGRIVDSNPDAAIEVMLQPRVYGEDGRESRTQAFGQNRESMVA